MESKKIEGGYTFASVLLTLTIILIVMPVIVLLLQLIRFEPDESYIDAHQFFNFLYTDALDAENIEINNRNNVIYFKIKGEEKESEISASVEQYGNVIRRRVQGKGHEIYLRGIDTFHASPLSYGFKVELVMENGEMYEKTIEHTLQRE